MQNFKLGGKAKQPYCFDFVIDNDVDNHERLLVLMPHAGDV